MTTYEHAMLGINGALATGVHVRHGWKIVALAGIAAVAPDWDGLPMLVNMAAYEVGHRVWGHNVLACIVLGVLLGTIDYRYDISGHIARRLVGFGPLREFNSQVGLRTAWSRSAWLTWICVASAAALSQIPADAVVSGADGLSDWAIKPFWPFSNVSMVYPMVPWGNVGVTIIFATGMLSQARWKSRLQPIAIATLASVTAYIMIWGMM